MEAWLRSLTNNFKLGFACEGLIQCILDEVSYQAINLFKRYDTYLSTPCEHCHNCEHTMKIGVLRKDPGFEIT